MNIQQTWFEIFKVKTELTLEKNFKMFETLNYLKQIIYLR